MFEKLVSHLSDGSLNRIDLLKMLRTAEEYGSQHIFLFDCTKPTATSIVNENTLRESLQKLDLIEILDRPRIVAKPKGLELTEARIDRGTDGISKLLIKAVDIHSYRERKSKEVKGDLEIETYQWQHDRVVDMFSLSSDGLLEVKIESRKNVVDYEELCENLLAKATGIIERIKFSAKSLAKTRISLIKGREKLGNLVRFADNQLRDGEGRVITVATGFKQQELYPKGSASDKAVEGFLSVGIPLCDEVDCFWLKKPGLSVPSKELHTLIGGADHEFTITTRSDRKDYEYALAQILRFTNN